MQVQYNMGTYLMTLTCFFFNFISSLAPMAAYDYLNSFIETFLFFFLSIQCPNPDFNKSDYRWRMLQRTLVEAIVDLLTFEGKVNKVSLPSDIFKFCWQNYASYPWVTPFCNLVSKLPTGHIACLNYPKNCDYVPSVKIFHQHILRQHLNIRIITEDSHYNLLIVGPCAKPMLVV